jgi:hypothetical protein
MMEPVRDVEPCVRLASWSCRPCFRVASIGVVRLEHFHRRLFIFFVIFASIACWMDGRHVRAALQVK